MSWVTYVVTSSQLQKKITSITALLKKHANCDVQKPNDAAVNHFSGPLRKQRFTSMGSKGRGLIF